MFLEVTDPRALAAWSCFVSHRLSVVNQKADGASVTKESQNRYSTTAKDWGWREFVTLTSLFDQDAGYLVNDTVVFAAEVLVLKETTESRTPAEADVGKVCARSPLCLSFLIATLGCNNDWWQHLSLHQLIVTHIVLRGSEHRASGPELNGGLFGTMDQTRAGRVRPCGGGVTHGAAAGGCGWQRRRSGAVCDIPISGAVPPTAVPDGFHVEGGELHRVQGDYGDAQNLLALLQCGRV
jgi:hypothetical protein